MVARRTAQTPKNEQIPEIKDGEVLEIVDKRTIQRKTVSNDATAGTKRTIEVEPDEDTDEPLNNFGEGLPSDSLLYLLFEDEKPEDSFLSETCNVLVRREPDLRGEVFVTPCSTRGYYPPITDLSLAATGQDEITGLIRQLYGGGHYFCQLQIKGRLFKSWRVDLLDTPDEIRRAREGLNQIQTLQTLQTNSPAATVTATTPENPMLKLLEEMELQQRFKKVMFGSELEELEEYRRKDRERQTVQTGEPPNEKLSLLQFALDSKNENVLNKALSTVLGDESNGIVDTAKFIFENDEKIISIGERLASAIFGGSSPTKSETKNAMDGILGKKNNPAKTEQEDTEAEPKSTFRRKRRPQEKKNDE